MVVETEMGIVKNGWYGKITECEAYQHLLNLSF